MIVICGGGRCGEAQLGWGTAGDRILMTGQLGSCLEPHSQFSLDGVRKAELGEEVGENPLEQAEGGRTALNKPSIHLFVCQRQQDIAISISSLECDTKSIGGWVTRSMTTHESRGRNRRDRMIGLSLSGCEI